MRDNASADVYRFGVHAICPATRRLQLGAQKIDAEAKVFDLILLRVEIRERALTNQGSRHRVVGATNRSRMPPSASFCTRYVVHSRTTESGRL